MQLRKKESKNINKSRKSQLLVIGSLLLIIGGAGILGFRYYQSYRDNKVEQKEIEEFIDIQRDVITSGTIDPSKEVEEEQPKQQVETDYIAVLEIPKINLRKGIYAKDSSKNNVNKNIELMKESNMPDEVNGNFILAGHSGTSRVSYFKNLHKLENGDLAYIYYNGSRLVYKLVNSYDIQKTGEASIARNGQKTTLTLITCRHNTDKQTIFIFELMEDGA